MKKLKILGSILLVVIVILIIGGLTIWKLLSPPSVKRSDRKNVTFFVENYLTEKYGKHNFKVTGVEYDFNMTRLFDYSNRVGYNVRFKCDIVNYSFIYISGIDPKEFTIIGDTLLEDYYFPNLYLYRKYEAMESLIPVEKIQSNFFNRFKQDFEPSCQTLKCYNPKLDIPNNLGRIPTMEEIKSNISYYEVRNFTYTLTDRIENKEEYENKLDKYLKQNFGGDWSIYFNSDISISCLKQ